MTWFLKLESIRLLKIKISTLRSKTGPKNHCFTCDGSQKHTLPRRVPCVELLQASAQVGDW